MQTTSWHIALLSNMQPIFQIVPVIPITSIIGVLFFPGTNQKAQIAFCCHIALVSCKLEQCPAFCVFYDVFFLKNSGHGSCSMSFNLDLFDCFLMISVSLNILIKNKSEVMLCPQQCVSVLLKLGWSFDHSIYSLLPLRPLLLLC